MNLCSPEPNLYVTVSDFAFSLQETELLLNVVEKSFCGGAHMQSRITSLFRVDTSRPQRVLLQTIPDSTKDTEQILGEAW